MQKSHVMTLRLSPEEKRALERMAEAAGLPVSAYARACLSVGPVPGSGARDVESLAREIADLRDELRAALNTYERLATSVAELVRVPSLAEYRLRRRAEGYGPKDDTPAAEAAEIVERIKEYRSRYGRDVDPDPRTWGRIPSGYTVEQILAMAR